MAQKLQHLHCGLNCMTVTGLIRMMNGCCGTPVDPCGMDIPEWHVNLKTGVLVHCFEAMFAVQT